MEFKRDELSLQPRTDFIEEDPRSVVIKELGDPEEINAALEIIADKYKDVDTPFNEIKDTELNPEKKSEPAADTSDKKIQTNDKPANDDKISKDDPAPADSVKPLVITEEFIASQPEETRDILKKYEGKNKAELAKAASHAIAQKNPYLKDNEEAINAVAKSLEQKSDDELLKTLYESQKEIGKQDTQVNPPAPADTSKANKEPLSNVELPELPTDDPNVKKILDQEVVKNLKKKYPDMPDDLTSVEFKEWERDLLDQGLLTANKFIKDKEAAEASITTDLKKVVYAQSNLSNLYNEDPSEILPMLTPENLPKLKYLNDNFVEINNKALELEVTLLKKELQEKYGIAEKDLGLDLSLSKNEKGSLANEYINGLLLQGGKIDPQVVGFIGQVPYLKKGALVEKFIAKNTPKIITLTVNNQLKAHKQEVEKVKSETLNTLGGQKNNQSAKIEKVDLQALNDENQIKKVMDSIYNKY